MKLTLALLWSVLLAAIGLLYVLLPTMTLWLQAMHSITPTS